MYQQSDQRKFYFARADLFPEVLRRSTDHLPNYENSDDEKEQHVDHADAFPAIDAIHPHAKEGRQGCHRVKTVVLADDRAASKIHRGGREGRAGGSAEAQFLALQVAEMLVKRQTRHRRQSDIALAAGRRRAWNRERSTLGMGYQSRIRFQRIKVDRPNNRTRKQNKHHRKNDKRVTLST